MALINLQTDLTSLKYGHDRPAGGSSNQPYIQTDIPDGDLPAKSPDFLLRNGFLAPVAAAKDTSRITQMFFDTKSPRGLLFIAKENLLSRISVRTQATDGPAYAGKAFNQGVYLPTSTIAQTLVGFTGTHLNLLGLDPSSPMSGVVEGDGLLDALGLPGLGLKTYESVVKNQKSKKNRLVKLTKKKQNKILTDPYGNILKPYDGGPGSILGIGKTHIKFADQRTGINNTTSSGGISLVNKDTVKISKDNGYGILLTRFRQITSTKSNYYQSIDDFRKPLLKDEKSSTIMGLAPSYKNKLKTIDGNSTSRINYVSPGQRGNVINYTNGKRDLINPDKKIGPVDRINAFPIYQSNKVFADGEGGVNDLVKFRIAAIDNVNPIKKDYIHFRAYIDSFSDNYSGNWDAINYMGRGESFYKYSNFKRGISLAFTVAAQSKQELIPMYKKLNFLASNLAPTYSDKGYMAGSLVTLTLGGWCYELPGFITSMTLDVPMESPWEIGINTEGESDPTVKELPMIVKVSGFSFTPIEEFRPAKQKNTYGDPNINLEDTNTYGPERYIALAKGEDKSDNNYDSK